MGAGAPGVASAHPAKSRTAAIGPVSGIEQRIAPPHHVAENNPPMGHSHCAKEQAFVSKGVVRSRLRQKFVDAPDFDGIELHLPVIGQQAVDLLLDIGELRVADAGESRDRAIAS